MKRLLFIVLSFPLCSLLTGCPDSGEEHVRKGHVFFSSGDLEAAEREYQRAIELSPNHAAALEGMGDILFERRELSLAEAWYRKAATADPRSVNARHRLAVTLSERGDLEQAATVLEEALRIDARDVFALHALGGLYYKRGELARAEAAQNAVLRVDERHRAARFALANILIDGARFEEAERELTRLESEGGKALAEYGLARISAKQGRFDDTARHLESVLALGLTHPGKVLSDPVFTEGWSHPSMQVVRAKLEEAGRRPSG